MKTIKTIIQNILWTKQEKYNVIKLWYWENVTKELKPVEFQTYLSSEKDDFGFNINKKEIEQDDCNEDVDIEKVFDSTIPYHRVLRITENDNVIWERTYRLNKLNEEKSYERKK